MGSSCQAEYDDGEVSQPVRTTRVPGDDEFFISFCVHVRYQRPLLPQPLTQNTETRTKKGLIQDLGLASGGGCVGGGSIRLSGRFRSLGILL